MSGFVFGLWVLYRVVVVNGQGGYQEAVSEHLTRRDCEIERLTRVGDANAARTMEMRNWHDDYYCASETPRDE